MRKIIILALIASLSSAVPANLYAQDAAPKTNPPAQGASDTHKLGKTAGTMSEGGIIAVTVTVLGLIALAASSDSGDATPAATSHPR